jgi:hypothetical protein
LRSSAGGDTWELTLTQGEEHSAWLNASGPPGGFAAGYFVEGSKRLGPAALFRRLSGPAVFLQSL